MGIKLDADDIEVLLLLAVRGIAFMLVTLVGAASLGLAWRVFDLLRG